MMKRFILILSLVLTLIMTLGTVTAFASGEEIEQIPYTFGEEEFYGDEDMNEILESILGGYGQEFLGVAIISTVCMTLFVPVFVVMIVFIVLNSKTKKKIREYQNLQPFVPANVSGIFSQPVNVNPAPMGNNPADYRNPTPQNNVNGQGGAY